jgi:hypothetical protein
MGYEEEAEKELHDAVQVLTTFSGTFKDACYDQSFDPVLAVNLTRQNELLGTGIDLMPCADRKFTAQVATYTFESCSLGGEGEWKVTWNIDPLGEPGKGTGTLQLTDDRQAAQGPYSVRWTGQFGVSYATDGQLTFTAREKRDAAGKIVGRDYTLAGTVSVALKGGQAMVMPLARLAGKTPGGKSSFKVDVTVSEKPCKPSDS